MFCYKLNIYNPHESLWEGSRICLKKNLKSIDFLRQKVRKKNTRYPFWRIDKEKSIQLIENGGWHFNYLSDPDKISKKLKTFAHTQYNKDEFTKIDVIEKMQENKILLEERFSDHPYPVIRGIIDALLIDAPSGCVLLGQRNIDQVNSAATLGGKISQQDVDWIKSLYSYP